MREKKTRDKSEELKKLHKRLKRLTQEKYHLKQDKRGLEEEIKQLWRRNQALEFQLQEYRKKFFKKKKQREDADQDSESKPKKKGAPVGHPGKTREVPDQVDEHQDVCLTQCPHCHSQDLSLTQRYEDHYQEDIVLPEVQVTRFRHHFYYCRGCQQTVYGVGKGEMPGSFIGPVAKSLSSFFHYQMGIPYRKIKRLFEECFHMRFVPSSCPGFDKQARVRGQPLYEKLKQKVSRQPFNHVDETGWRVDGDNRWLWCFAGPQVILYLIDPRRGGQVPESILGENYSGVVISDFLGAYNRLKARKQRCLVHLLRLIKKWLVYFENDRKITHFLNSLKKLIQEIIELSRRIKEKQIKNFSIKKVDLIARLRRTLKKSFSHPKAERFRNMLLKHFEELVTCLEFKEICSHNNWVERMLRPNVILRKITFGNRSENGVQNHQVLMSLIETVKHHQLNPIAFLQQLLTDKTQTLNLIKNLS